jgi:hypothetical protein
MSSDDWSIGLLTVWVIEDPKFRRTVLWTFACAGVLFIALVVVYNLAGS